MPNSVLKECKKNEVTLIAHNTTNCRFFMQHSTPMYYQQYIVVNPEIPHDPPVYDPEIPIEKTLWLRTPDTENEFDDDEICDLYILCLIDDGLIRVDS